MIRFIIVILAMFGGYIGFSILASKYPIISHHVFNIGGFDVTWLIIGTCVIGYTAIKVSK